MTQKANYKLGAKSLENLEGVHPELVLIVRDAIKITEQDFSVFDGLRTEEEQRENIRKGHSWSMVSKHLPQADGFSHAVDLVPYIDGKLKWDWDGCYEVARAMRTAAKKRDRHLRWGGFWGRLTITTLSPRALVEDYLRRKKAKGQKSRADGPHFEIMKV